MQSAEHMALCCLRHEQRAGMRGQHVDPVYSFLETEGGLLMSGKVEQTMLITDTLLEVAVVQLVAVMCWWNSYKVPMKHFLKTDLHLTTSCFVLVQNTGAKECSELRPVKSIW